MTSLRHQWTRRKGAALLEPTRAGGVCSLSPSVRTGLTLFETMLTVALLAAATALVFPSVVSRLSSLTFDESVTQVQASLRLAQANAASDGVAVRIEASRAERGGRWVLVAVPFGDDDDPAAAWVETAASGEELNSAGIGDGFAEGPGGFEGPAFPLPDSSLPAEVIGSVAGKVLYRLPDSVGVERAASPEEDLGEFGIGLGVTTGPGGGPSSDGGPGEGMTERGGLDEDGLSITVAVVLSDGSMVAAPGAALVSEQGRLAFVGVDPWSGHATVELWSGADAFEGAGDQAAGLNEGDGRWARDDEGRGDGLGVPDFAPPAVARPGEGAGP
ncbi:MAG: hypothetical protein AAF297_08240 [Planctomycetota bacterium]